MRLAPIEGNRQALDGGAMFGNAPRELWRRWIPPDAINRIPLACRALLVQETGGRNILLEAGIGAFFEPAMAERYGVVERAHVLLDSLAAVGLRHEDIDIVVLSHLHFDHAGGLLSAWEDGREPALLFPRARFVIGKAAWERALRPHARDRASFVPGLNAQLEASGRVVLAGAGTLDLLPGGRFEVSDGHTPGLLCAVVPSDDGEVLFAADMVPGLPWVHLPITMGYDRFPELLIDEKARVLGTLADRGGRVFFTHDASCAVARVVQERGRFRGEVAALHVLG